MHSAVWFWLALVFGAIVLVEVAVVTWAIVASVRETRRQRQVPTTGDPPRGIAEDGVNTSFPTNLTVCPKDGKVEFQFSRSVTSVGLAPEVARFISGKIREAADVAEKAATKKHNLLPTAWDRLKDD